MTRIDGERAARASSCSNVRTTTRCRIGEGPAASGGGRVTW